MTARFLVGDTRDRLGDIPDASVDLVLTSPPFLALRSYLPEDPFAGSGTTLAVAQGMGRQATGIDLDERNAWLARERVGMFLDIDQRQDVK